MHVHQNIKIRALQFFFKESILPDSAHPLPLPIKCYSVLWRSGNQRWSL